MWGNHKHLGKNILGNSQIIYTYTYINNDCHTSTMMRRQCKYYIYAVHLHTKAIWPSDMWVVDNNNVNEGEKRKCASGGWGDWQILNKMNVMLDRKSGNMPIISKKSKKKVRMPYLIWNRGGTQLWVGYGCAARSFDHHPITKPEKTQICNL